MKDKPKLSVNKGGGKEKLRSSCTPFINLKSIAETNEFGQLVTHDGKIIPGIRVVKQPPATLKQPIKLA